MISTSLFKIASLCAMAIALSATTMTTTVDAHGVMSVPKTTFKGNGRPMDPAGLVPRNAIGLNQNGNPGAFATAFKASGKYTSIRDYIMKTMTVDNGATKEYGRTDPNGAKQPIPAAMEWSGGENGGLTPSHAGPLEVWCDDVLVASVENTGSIGGAPARIPIDQAKCQGKALLSVFWIALHQDPYQTYIQTAPLVGGTPGGAAPAPAAGGNNNNGGNATAPVPAKTTMAPMKGCKGKLRV